MSSPEKKRQQLEEKLEKRLAYIRHNPLTDRYGRAVVDGSPIGQGDANWSKHYGVGGHSSIKTPILGIGVARDSYLPSSYRDNEKKALRVLDVDKHTPRSTKLTREVRHWAIKHHLHNNTEFMTKLVQVTNRVKPLKYLGLQPKWLAELKPMIFKFANFSLQDARNP